MLRQNFDFRSLGDALSDLLKIVLALPGFSLSRLFERFPKRRNRVVVLAPKSGAFSDNSKYAYLALAGADDLDLWYMTDQADVADELREAGLSAIARPSIRAFWVLLRAKVAIGCDYEAFRGSSGNLVAGARRVQLWHGSGIKNVSIDSPNLMHIRGRRIGRARLAIKRKFPVFDLFYFPSRQNFQKRQNTFRFRRAALNGLLRNDLLAGKGFGPAGALGTDIRCGSRIEAEKAAGRNLVLFAPTWRTTDRQDIGQRIPFDMCALDDLMRKLSATLVVKLHPAMIDRIETDRFANIVTFAREKDIYPHLGAFDLMISDFSSFIPDFALLGRPIILYLPDYDDLLREKRFSPTELDRFMGERCFDHGMLLVSLERYLRNHEAVSFSGIERFHDLDDGRNCARFVADIRKLLDLSCEGPGSEVLAVRQKTGITPR